MADEIEAIAETFRLLDSETYEQALELIDERFVMETPSELASEPDVYRGPEGVRRWWESFLEVMESVRVEVEEVHPVDHDTALVEFTIKARGGTTGIDTEQRAATSGHVAISFPVAGGAEHTSAMGIGMVERPP